MTPPNIMKVMKQLSGFSDEQIDEWASQTKKITYKTDEYFSTPHNPSKSLAIVEKGLFRFYVFDVKGIEATLGFTGEGMFMSSYSAIILNQIQPVYIQALENSEIYAMSRSDFLNKWWEADIRWKNILQTITEYDCLQVRKRELGFLLYDAQMRYNIFTEEFAQYADRIKLKYIASYLGISPETLSRIRRKN